MSYLVLHIDTEFIVGTICTDNGNSYPIANDTDNLLWLYFFNNPHQNRISFGKENKAHYNNKEINYYGNLFKLIENEQEKFTIRSIQKKSIELLHYSGLLKILKEKYESVTHETTEQIPTLITFSLSISELAKQKTVEYLKSQEFKIDSYTIPLSELTCYYPFNQKKIIPAKGSAVLLLAATNTSLHLIKLVFSDNYFMIDGEVKICKGKGIDPRKRALVMFVVKEINKLVGALTTQDEIEDECARIEQKAEEWLRRIDAQQQNRPFAITESLSIMPNAIKQILIKKDNIESDTGYYIQELMDIFDAYKSDNIRGDLAAIFLLGDCFQNSLVKNRFEKEIQNGKLFSFANKDIQQILSIYPKIDFKRYIDQEARIKALAEAEEQKQAEQRALEDRKRKDKEIESNKIAETKKVEQNRKEAEQSFERAVELEKEGKLEDARVNGENALALDKSNRGYKQFVSDLIEKIDRLNAKNELYKSFLNKADKFLEENKLNQALDEYEAAQSIFDNTEITKNIIKVKRLIKNVEKTKATISQLLSEIKLLEKKGENLLAQKKVEEILYLDKDHSEAKVLLSKIDQSLQLQIKKQQEEENKAECEKKLIIGNNLFDENKWIEAQQQYEMALILCPTEKVIKDRIRQCAEKIKEYAEKIKEQESAFKELLFSASIAEDKGKLKDALSYLEKAALLKSDEDLLSRIKIVKNKIKFDFGKDQEQNDIKPKEEKDFLNIKSPPQKKEDKDFIKKTQQNSEDEDFLNTKSQPQKKEDNDFIKKTQQDSEEEDFLNIKSPPQKKEDKDFIKKADFDNW